MQRDDVIHRLLNIENETRRLVRKYEPVVEELDTLCSGIDYILDRVDKEGVDEYEGESSAIMDDLLTGAVNKLRRILPNADAFNDMIGNECQNMKYVLEGLGFGGGQTDGKD